MKRLLTVGLLISLTLLQGCSVIMNMRGAAFETDISNKNPNKVAEPVMSEVFNNVQSVAIADLTDGLEGYPADNILVYKAMITELHLMLEESGQFRVVGPDEFRTELRKVNGPINPRLAADYEIDSIFQKVGKSLGVHAVVSVGLEETENVQSMGNQLRYMRQVIVDGGLTLELEGYLKLIRSRQLETLYEQRSDISWASGTTGLDTIPANRLRSMMRDMLKPMVSQMVDKHRG